MPRRNIVLRSQARQMVHDVLTYMKNEAQEGLQFDIKAAQKRTAAATGVSIRTVQSIARAANVPGASMHEVFRTPGKKRTGRKKVTAMDSFQQGVIKRCIHKFHSTENELPTVDRLLRKLKQKVNFQGSSSSLRRILKELGFKWRRTEDKRQVLIEHSHIRLKRIEYLQNITKYREEGRPVVFTDASYVDTQTKSDETSKGPKKNRKGDRVIIVHAVTESGFLPNTLLMFKAGTKTDDNRHYDKWFRTKLIPNLPENTVVVVGKAPYFNKLEETVPSSTSKRFEMETWLFEKGIPFNPNTLKPQLYKIVCAYKDCFKKYKIDSVLSEKNHPVIRFPSFHLDLNPLEMAWTAIKGYVAEKNGAKTIVTVKQVVQQKVKAMNEEFSAFCRQIKDIEEEYIQNDMVIDQLTDDVTVHVSDNESDDQTDEDSGSDDEQNDDSSSDEELVSKKEAVFIQCNVSPEAILSHSKWLNKTFGDIRVSEPNCQTVCQDHIDPLFLRIIKQRKICIRNFHRTNKEIPTVEKLRRKLQEDINFQGSKTSLRQIIKDLGFRWMKTKNNRKLLIETSNIRLKRIEYLQKIKK
ncbi:putative dde superfamily endonuclease [Operophtera brumata]|uniref:Putative dde superfamily endonuclease n=1 Tax=Operophtera brumata TaxID=104452 RepID=A0A0L7L5F0_OPEBR|nr:putative dde superfamily endonuclease [Operophtera brumata]